MAVTTDGSSKYLMLGSALVTAEPWTMSAFASAPNQNVNNEFFSQSLSSGTRYTLLSLSGANTGDPAEFHSSNTTPAKSTSGYTANVVCHVCGQSIASNSHVVWLNGANKGTSTSPSAGSNFNRVGVGIWYYNSTPQYRLCTAFDCAIWNVALSDQEVASLAAGFVPLFVRPASISAWWPLGGAFPNDGRDPVKGNTMTAYNTPTWTGHSKSIYHCDCCCA